MMPSKKLSILLIVMMASVMAACSGLKATSTGGGGGGGGTGVTATIQVQVTGLANGASVIFQNKGGDSLTVTTNGTFSFKTQTDTYDVTVNKEPTTPNQICTVANGQGTPTTATVTVMVSCVNSYTVGGTVSGVVGSGFTLVDTDGSVVETLPISSTNGNQPFTFTQLVPTGSTYTVTIGTQPSSPSQTCTVQAGTGTGTATGNVNTVVVTCVAVTYSVGGNVVGLRGETPNNGPLVDGSFVIQNSLGNTLIIPQNGPFTFATPEALGDQYEVSVLHGPSTPGPGCTFWDYKGVVTANVTDILLDCGYDDWTWINGGKTAATVIPDVPQYGSFPASAPTSIPNPLTNTPGARYGSAAWTDNAGNLWLFSGSGWELSGKTNPDTLDFPQQDMWVCVMIFGDTCQWQLVGGYDPTPIGSGTSATTVGKQIIAAAQNAAFYPFAAPVARLGSAAWKDSAGNFWLFGGSDGNRFLNDVWEYHTTTLSPYDNNTLTTKEAAWSFVGGTLLRDQPGIYPPSVNAFPGARTNAVTWTDPAGNFWLFGGYGWDGQSTSVLGFLNDLWEYTGGTWVFVAGSSKANQLGVYGTAGQAAATNLPGGRQEAAAWTDANGNLWLFGGEGEDSVGTANGILNDMWMFNPTSGQWTFVQGSMTANVNGVYGPQTSVGAPNATGAAGTVGLLAASSTTFPGSRWGASAWTDAGGDLWLFGGWGLDSNATNGNGALDDLWVYVPSSTAGQPGTWTWIKGADTGSKIGNYGDELIPYKTYELWIPGGRSNSTTWVDHNNQLWLFGGKGYDSTSGSNGNGSLNDMWRYIPYPD